jgi:magnesium chelatase family protein
MVKRYRSRISGPLLDRIDLHVPVPRLRPSELRPDSPAGESSLDVRARVVAARARQHARASKANSLLEHAVDALQLSARSIHRILRVARTIADLADQPHILTTHLTEALSYRQSMNGAAATR